MHFVDEIIDEIEQLSLLVFDEKANIGFFQTERRLMKGMGWQAVIVRY